MKILCLCIVLITGLTACGHSGEAMEQYETYRREDSVKAAIEQEMTGKINNAAAAQVRCATLKATLAKEKEYQMNYINKMKELQAGGADEEAIRVQGLYVDLCNKRIKNMETQINVMEQFGK